MNEVCFTKDRCFNSCNSHIWDDHNLYARCVCANREQFAINMRKGIIDAILIGPFLLSTRINGNIYLYVSQNILPVLLKNTNVVPGVSTYFDRKVQVRLNQ